ncbi:MAG: DUF4249 domain-containing protein [Saprospiraceae bacterium]
MRILTYLGLICIALFSSCSEDFFSPVIEIDLPVPKAKLVVYGHLEEGSDTIYIQVTRTRPLLDNTAYPALKTDTFFYDPRDRTKFYIHHVIGSDTVSNVVIHLSLNKTSIASFNDVPGKKGVYYAVLPQPLQFEPGNEYTLQVSAPGYTTVEATESMPRPVDIDSIAYRKKIRLSIPGDPFNSDVFNEYSYYFKDPGPDLNYYFASGYYWDSIHAVTQPIDLFSYDLKSVEGFLSDESFNGKPIVWNVHEYVWNHSGQFQYAYFYLHSLSKAYYLYQLSIRRYEKARDDPFAEPVILYTNIKNGYGFFSLGASRKYLLNLK